jgi:hypothetical protein
VKEGWLVDEDWSRMEYSYYLLKSEGLDEQTVMTAINRAKRRFFLRPAYLARHFGDAVRLVRTKPAIVTSLLSRLLLGQAMPETRPDAARRLPASPASQA